jgi:cytochrome b6-f complex iron-sulfur subunit
MDETKSEPQAGTSIAQDLSRRSFLTLTAKLSLGAAGLVTSGGVLAVAYSAAGKSHDIVLGRLTLSIDALVFMPEHNLFIVRTDCGLGAFSSRCTHLGCTVKQSGDGLICPCHGARYDRQGRVYAGPAPRDLPWLAVKVQAGGLVVIEPREVPLGTVTPLLTELMP